MIDTANTSSTIFHIFVIFSVVICRQFHLYPGLVFLLLLHILKMCKWTVHCGTMIVFVCLHIVLLHCHHYANLSEDIGFLKYLLGTFCGWSQFSQLTLMQHMGLCVWEHYGQFLLWEQVYVILISSSIRKYDPFVIVQAKFMKQWYALYVVLCFMGISVEHVFGKQDWKPSHR